MKKIFMVFSVMLCLLLAAGIAMASQSVTGTGDIGSSSGGSLSVTTSSNVQILYSGSSQAYGTTSDHIAGNRVYGTGASEPAMYYKDKTAGQHWTSDPTTAFDTNGWTAQ